MSAKSAAALDAAASRLADHVRTHPEQALGDIAYSLATTRSHHEHRLALAAATREELVSGLEAAARGETVDGLCRGRASEARVRRWCSCSRAKARNGWGWARSCLAE